MPDFFTPSPITRSDVSTIVVLTQAQYDAIATKAAKTAYFITSGTAATPTTQFDDQFTRTLSNAFGTSDTGQTWTLVNTSTAYAVNGNAGTITHTAVNTGFTAYVPLALTTQDAVARFSYSTVPTAGAYVFSIVGRYTSGTQMYRCKVTVNPAASAMALTVEKTSANTSNVLTAVTNANVTLTGTNYAAAAQYWVRFAVAPTATAGTSSIQARVWADGVTQPTTWNIDTTDNDSALQSAANFGVYSVVNGTASPASTVLSVHEMTVLGIA